MQRITRFTTSVALAIALIPAGAVTLRAQEISVAGEWELVVGTQKGDVIWRIVFAQTGESLEVTMTGPQGKEAKGPGTLKGDAIEWSIRVSTPRGEMDVAYKGVVAGDAMTGEVKRGNIGTAGWSAKRKAPSS